MLISRIGKRSGAYCRSPGQRQRRMEDFEMAREKIIMGTERRNLVMSRKDIENTAFHEGGHALVSALLRQKAAANRVYLIRQIPA